MVHPWESGGIGNRMPAIITGFALALSMHRTLLVIWDSNELSLSDIFNPGFDLLCPSWLDLTSRNPVFTYSLPSF